MADGDDSTTTRRRRRRRTWPQRLSIAAIVLAAFGCFAAAGAIYAGQQVLEDRKLSPEIVDPSAGDAGFATGGTPDAAPSGEQATASDTGEDDGEAPASTFPEAEPDARNFLITGADNNSCIDPDSPYAPAFGDRSAFGERSDTIMLLRVNPATNQAAVLSFPRDLWVTIPGRSGKQRINVAYERDNPQKLIDTLWENFGLLVDHSIQIDFCAFKTLVDAVDGVEVPFETPVRDERTGLNVPEAGCFSFDGDHALAYVRSRYMQSFVDGEWQTDGTSDLGRISRQQDFLRRVLQQVRSAGLFDPDVIGALLETNLKYLVTDPGLTPDRMLEFAGVMANVDPTQLTTYQIEARGDTIQGQSVLIPRIDGDNMQAILQVFRGQATLANGPQQVFDEDTFVEPAEVATAPAVPVFDAGDDAPATAVEVEVATPTTLPSVQADENQQGVFPEAAVTCG